MHTLTRSSSARVLSILSVGVAVTACGSSDSGGDATTSPGGTSSAGGSSAGTSSTGGTSSAGKGGTSAGTGGSAAKGGTSAAGGAAAGMSSTGGSSAGKSSAGGASAGTSSAGGASAGTSSAGGASAGGASAGGASAGTSAAGGASAGTSAAGGASAGTSAAGGSSAGTSAAGGSAGSAAFPTVFTIVLENHDYAEIVGSPNAPYINSLIAQGLLATNYMDSGTHPSLPNYLYMTSGQTLIAADVDPTKSGFPKDVDNLGHQLNVAGVPWHAYMESMGTPCKLTGAGTYAPRHNPFLYYTDFQTDPTCKTNDVDYSNFAADLQAGTYAFMWITPNLTSDGHDPALDPVTGLKDSDAWLAKEVPTILASDAYKAGGILFITWDEAEGRNGDSKDQIPMIILSPQVKPGTKTNVAFSHADYLATIEDLYGLPRLGAAKTAKSLTSVFLPL